MAKKKAPQKNKRPTPPAPPKAIAKKKPKMARPAFGGAMPGLGGTMGT